MSRWFRHYAGMMRDDKLVSAAIRSKQPVERVVWVWGAILESAAEIDDDGRFNLDAAEVAYFLRADEADIRVVVDALVAMGRVSDDRVVKWGDRQFTSDRSADRQARYRERKRTQAGNGDENRASQNGGVTSLSRHGDAPETETELDTETERKDASQAQHPPAVRERDKALEDEFNEAWTDFPRHPNSRRVPALKAFANLPKPERLACIRGVARYAMAFEDDRADKRPMQERLRYVPHLVTWIHQRGWEAVLEQVA